MMNEDHYKWTYENADEFGVFPTNAVTVAHRGPMSKGVFEIPGMPEFNPMMLLHGEESVTFVKPLMPDTKYRVNETIADMQDKGSGALMIADSTISEVDSGDVAAVVRSGIFIRGMGGFGHKGTVKNVYPALPKRNPDMVKEEVTDSNQAFLYRLNGDKNPLHVDPQMAAMGNFDKPIFHGLGFFGVTARSIQGHFCKDSADDMLSFSSRFVGHVFPGETLVVAAWKEADTVIFGVKTKERGKPVIQGFATLKPQAKL